MSDRIGIGRRSPRQRRRKPNISVAFAGIRRNSAQTALKQAIQLKPTYAQAHYALGLVYASLKDKDGVTREFAILKRLDPKLAEQFYNAVKQ